MKRLLLLLSLLLFTQFSFSQQKQVYVSSSGMSNGDGSSSKPYASIMDAINTLKTEGGTVVLKDGIYHEKVSLDRFNYNTKKPTFPIIIKAENKGKAIIDGTVNIDSHKVGEWEIYKDDIYRVKINEDIWQLFSEGKALTTARFPDANYDDEHFWNLKETHRFIDHPSSFGHTYDARPDNEVEHEQGGDVFQEEGFSNELIRDGYNLQSLAETKVSMKGAIAVLHIGSWLTWHQVIEEHTAGSNEFTYDTDFSAISDNENNKAQTFAGNEKFWNDKNRKGEQAYYFIEGFQCLNKEKEWWYDKDSKFLYVIPPMGVNKKEWLSQLKGKNTTYSFDFFRTRFITLEGLTFFGTTLKSIGGSDLKINNCVFDHPSWSRRVLGDLSAIKVTEISNNLRDDYITKNKISNTVFKHADGSGLVMLRGRRDTLDNVLMHDVNYSCIGESFTINLRGSKDDYVHRLSLYNTGAAHGIMADKGATVMRSHFWNTGNLQHDGASIQYGLFDKAEIGYCWSHDSARKGFRFDDGGGHSSGKYDPSRNGHFHHNVSWNTRGIVIKGDDHLLNNNLIFNSKVGLIVLDWEVMLGVNKGTSTVQNYLDILASRWWGGDKRPQVPGLLVNNELISDVTSIYVDPWNADFRPKKPFENLKDHNLSGVPNDYIGPYDYDGEYWIPGYRYDKASTPIPNDHAKDIKKEVKLMWLEGQGFNNMHVYFGDDSLGVANADKSSEYFQSETITNFFDPENVVSEKKYYWRIDTVTKGKLIKGDVWEFSTKGYDPDGEIPTSVDDQLVNEKPVKIYPNPSNHMMFIEGKGIQNIVIYSLVGEVMFKGNRPPNHAIDVTQFPKGLYLCKINFANNLPSITKKIYIK